LYKKERYPIKLNHVGDHIKKHRFDLKMKAVECQRILGVDKGTLADWEAGRHTPTMKNWARITNFLGYDPMT
jgi:DNA-binding transcriptional regulator YiaG